MRISVLFIFTLGILYNVASFSQDTAKTKTLYIDTNYIEKYTGFPTGYLSTYFKYNNIFIVDTSGNTLKYRPNIAASFGPGIGYKWFGVDLSFISFGKGDESIYGKTTKLDIQSHIYLKRFIMDFVLQDYKGFYLDSIIDTDTGEINLKRVIKKPDMKQQSVGGTIMMFTNYKKYSFKSTFSQTEYQKKSAGTWAFGLSFHYLDINSNNCLIDDSVKQYFDSTSFYKNITSMNAGVIGGYLYTLTLRKTYFTFSLLGGFNGKYQTFALENNILQEDTLSLSGHIQIRAGIGHNSRKLYYGLNWVGDWFSDFTKSKQSYGTVRVYLGYRFIPRSKRK